MQHSDGLPSSSGSPLPERFLSRLVGFADLFTRPTWSNVLSLLAGAVLQYHLEVRGKSRQESCSDSRSHCLLPVGGRTTPSNQVRLASSSGTSNGSHYSLATHAKPYSVGSGYRTWFSDLIAFGPYVKEKLLQVKFDWPVRLANDYWNTSFMKPLIREAIGCGASVKHWM